MTEGTITFPTAGSTSFRKSLIRAIGNPVDWKLGNRCAFVAAICLLFTVWVDLIARFAIAIPMSAPFLSRTALPILLHVEERMFVTGWVAIIALGVLIANKGYAGSRVLGHL